MHGQEHARSRAARDDHHQRRARAAGGLSAPLRDALPEAARGGAHRHRQTATSDAKPTPHAWSEFERLEEAELKASRAEHRHSDRQRASAQADPQRGGGAHRPLALIKQDCSKSTRNRVGCAPDGTLAVRTGDRPAGRDLDRGRRSGGPAQRGRRVARAHCRDSRLRQPAQIGSTAGRLSRARYPPPPPGISVRRRSTPRRRRRTAAGRQVLDVPSAVASPEGAREISLRLARRLNAGRRRPARLVPAAAHPAVRRPLTGARSTACIAGWTTGRRFRRADRYVARLHPSPLPRR